MTTYKVVRMFRRDDVRSKTIKTGLTLAEAQAHCKDPETSSSTCSSLEGLQRTCEMGLWFDGYDEERR
jgi:hypothetical protein